MNVITAEQITELARQAMADSTAGLPKPDPDAMFTVRSFKDWLRADLINEAQQQAVKPFVKLLEQKLADNRS